MDIQICKTVALRFVRGFVAGGIASMVLVLQAGVMINSVEDLKQLGAALSVAFITGGLLALDKLIRGENTSGEISLEK